MLFTLPAGTFTFANIHEVCPSCTQYPVLANFKFWSWYPEHFQKKIDKSRWQVQQIKGLTLNLLNFLNWIIHLPFLELYIIMLRDIKTKTWSWSANSVEPGQTVWMCRLTWLYTGGKGLSHLVPAGEGLQVKAQLTMLTWWQNELVKENDLYMALFVLYHMLYCIYFSWLRIRL